MPIPGARSRAWSLRDCRPAAGTFQATQGASALNALRTSQPLAKADFRGRENAWMLSLSVQSAISLHGRVCS